jgi:NAD(P)-dependent dehydrogenase (short-subunit alcohol dehydrogenase family)
MAISTLRRTPEGRELQFATNHLGHFQLALGLHDALAAAGHARIVSVSSSGNLASPVMFDDPDFRTTSYDPWVAYGQAKTANVLFAVGATNRWAADGIVANALHPGMIETNLGRHMDADTVAFHRGRAAAIRAGGGNGLKTPQQGAMTSVVLATWPGLDDIGGRYFEDGNEAEVVDPSLPQSSDPHGVAAYALDPDNADRLWELSLEMLAGR